MDRALQHARQGRWQAPPNPSVGAVVVAADGRVVGEGCHRGPGEAHAEAIALAQADRQARGGTLYVTLEPCTHYGRTPPCSEAIVRAGITRVVMAQRDPNPQVPGHGFERLTEAGVAVCEGPGRAEAEQINRRYLMAITSGRPVVVAKAARTLDGRIAGSKGEPLRITGPASGGWTGRRRSQVEGVLVGSGTVLTDDPRLTARDECDRLLNPQPVRVVADRRLRISPRSALLNRAAQGDVIIVTVPEMLEGAAADSLRGRGALLLGLPAEPERQNMRELLVLLARQGIGSVLVEGGATLLSALARDDLIDLWQVWIAPRIEGRGPGMLEPAPERPIRLGELTVEHLNEDLLVSALPADRDRER